LRQEVPVGHPDFGALVACECRKRAERQQDQEELYRVSNLGAYRRCTFETFHPLPEVAAALAAAQEFAAGLAGWLILCGRFGCGKTHLAASIANVALGQGTMTYFAVVPDLLDHLRATFGPTSDISYDERFEQVREAELLILDDLGTENATPWVREKLYQIINYRWIARRPTVVTTNVPFSQMDPRIVSRLRDQDLCRVLTIEAHDYRQRDNPDLN
jgi:DNA replication protein DnaC